MEFDFSGLSDDDFDKAQRAMWDEQIKRWVLAELEDDADDE